MNKFKKRLIGVSLLSLTLVPSVATVVTNPQIAQAVVYSYGGDDESCDVVAKKDDKSSTVGSVSEGDAGGDWTTEGSKQYQIAKTLFEVLTKEFGLSGTAAAGWLGNVQAESDFTPSMVEAENGQNYSGRGYGLFQFTPGEKYLGSKYYKKGAKLEEEIKNQVSFVMDSEFRNGEYRSYLPNAQSWFGISASGIEDIFDQKDPEKSTLIFFAVYERGDIAQMHRERRVNAAKKANELFNKDNIPADKSKWVTQGDGSSNSSTVDTGSDGSKGNTKDDCDNKEKKSVGGGAWGEDGTGEYSGNNGSWQAWKPDDLPEELKKYAINPESVGMKYGAPWANATGQPNSDGWFDYCDGAKGQCTEFANSIFYAIWQKDGKGVYYNSPNGDGVVAALVSQFGGKDTKEPKAGAIFSYHYGEYGHVGMVSHVFANGDYLIIEQNTQGMSGFQIGKPNTWNYQYVTKSSGETMGYHFFYPGDAGFTVNPNAKTMG